MLQKAVHRTRINDAKRSYAIHTRRQQIHQPILQVEKFCPTANLEREHNYALD